MTVLKYLVSQSPIFFYIIRFSLDNQSVFIYYFNVDIGAWLSLVERYVRDVEVVGSNPVAPIFP